MREILFRGKRKDNGEWVEGCLCISYDERVFIVYDEDFTLSSDCCGLHLISDRFFEVDPETVGQYTGLKDKNGVEIYEGDIVHCISRFDDAKMVVIFEEGEFRMILLEKIDTYVSGGGFYALRCFEKEVIGNIHDNRN